MSFQGTSFAPTGIGVLYGKADLLDTNATMAGWWQHDQRCHLREDALSNASGAIRGGTGSIGDAVGLGRP